MRPKLYYRVEENGVPFDNFCSDAAIGASERGVECITFTDINKVDKNPYNIVVTSVEESLEWLDQNIQAIDDKWATEFKKRKEVITTIDEITDYPCFIKPYKQIKAFTGLIVNDVREAKLFTQDFKDSVSCQEIVEFESEYRVYIHKDRGILGVKHYLGDHYIVPAKSFIDEVYQLSKDNLYQNSYTLDIGIDKKGTNYLIEINDGWAVGNYGLNPVDYFSFVKARWLQLTGVLK